jgi:cell division protein ZapA (FtsZ GTPase activity inhibitor)
LPARKALVKGEEPAVVQAEKSARSRMEAAEPVRGSDSKDPPPVRELAGQLLEEVSSEGTRKRAVAVRIAGREYRLRSDADPAWLQQVARQVDQAMTLIRERTDTVDTLEIAVLTALNLAREILLLREQLAVAREAETAAGGRGVGAADPDSLRALIELAESVLEPADRGA